LIEADNALPAGLRFSGPVPGCWSTRLRPTLLEDSPQRHRSS